MEPGTLTHLDRIVILFAVIGGVLVVLLPMIVVLMTPESPSGDRTKNPSTRN
jgi:hypothetical protein